MGAARASCQEAFGAHSRNTNLLVSSKRDPTHVIFHARKVFTLCLVAAEENEGGVNCSYVASPSQHMHHLSQLGRYTQANRKLKENTRTRPGQRERGAFHRGNKNDYVRQLCLTQQKPNELSYEHLFRN